MPESNEPTQCPGCHHLVIEPVMQDGEALCPFCSAPLIVAEEEEEVRAA